MIRTKREFKLEGLDCANCASKIEIKISQLEAVVAANVNFVTKSMQVELDTDKKDDVIIEIKQIIKKIEPHVVVVEKNQERYNQEILLLEGLDCANCANKIEKVVKNISGIESAYVDFMGKKLVFEAASSIKNKEIIEKIQQEVSKIESHVKVIKPQHKLDNDKQHEENGKKELRKIIIASVLFFIPIIISMPDIVRFGFYLCAYIIVGSKVLLRALKNILRGQVFDENFLMSIATIGAFAIGEFPEGVAVMLFYNVGEYIQSIAVNNSRKSIASLMDIRPDYANLQVEGEIKTVSPEQVNVGDIIVVRPGEKVPLDGKVIEGNSLMDTSALTGESLLREVEEGSEILSGFINNTGLLVVEVTKNFGESTVSKILDLVQNASGRKAPTENFITKFARYYTPIVVGIAVFLAIIPPLLIKEATFYHWIYTALVFLVISCPCALVISIPLGFFGGIGGASKKGILIKGSNYLEALNDIDTVVFDKTGTLTKGVFNVTKIETNGKYSKQEVLKYAAYAETYSTHPIAMSISKAYGLDVDENRLSNYKEITGHGISAVLDEANILVGNEKLMLKEKVEYKKSTEFGTIVHVAIENEHIGYIVISDQLKEDSQKAITDLKSMGIKKTVMLTGDNNLIAAETAKNLGIDKQYSELLPHEKVEKLELLVEDKNNNGKVLFVGDGINDAPVLARADVGVAMGGLGSDAAIEAADIVIMNDEPSKLVTAIKIARKTRKIVWQNIIFSMSVKIMVLLLGIMGLASIWQAVFADVGVTILAVFNAMRILKVKDL